MSNIIINKTALLLDGKVPLPTLSIDGKVPLPTLSIDGRVPLPTLSIDGRVPSLFIVILFCIDYFLIYKKTVDNNKRITEKQKAHILSIKASLTLFLLSCYFNYKFFLSNFNRDAYNLSLSNNDAIILHLSTLQLISYFISDTTIGFFKYHKYMCNLAGYTHHIIYIFISMLSIKQNNISYYLLYMIEELPTIFLSTGNYNKFLRNDNLFGLTFFCTRILYHIYLTWIVRDNILFLILGVLSLGLHSFWFKNWFEKYFLKIDSKKIIKKNNKKVKLL